MHALGQRVTEDAFSGFSGGSWRRNDVASSRLPSVLMCLGLHFLRAVPEVVESHSDDTKNMAKFPIHFAGPFHNRTATERADPSAVRRTTQDFSRRAGHR